MPNRRSKLATVTIPVETVAHAPKTLPVPHNSRSKQKLEPARTSKTTQKLVVFPEADLEQQSQEQTLQEDAFEDLKTFVSEPHLEQRLRRVTAYLTSESIRIREFQDLCSKTNIGFTDCKRIDEVMYTKYFADPAIQKSDIGDFEAAVASRTSVGEVFVFDYGVVVIWGLEESEEKKVLNALQPFESERLSPDDIEIENFYFCHNAERPPRLFNDVINLRSGHHMVKITISHSLAQSVKLAYFEELIDNTIFYTKNIPYELSVTGNIRMSRKEINKQIGELFAMRMNVNLVSNVLDTPELFWSYPSLGPLYRAVRGYLEISQRVEVVNQRCAVLSDMLDMLRDHANIMHGEVLEWIIILLIALEIFIGIAKTLIDSHYGSK